MNHIFRHSLQIRMLSALLVMGSAACGTNAPAGSGSSGTGQGSSTTGSGSGSSSGDVTSSGGPGSGGAGGMGGAASNGGAGGGGTGGMGGAASSSGAGGGGGCTTQEAQCKYKTDTELDKQSFRQIAGYNCLNPNTGWTFIPVATCDFSEVCESGNGPEAACVSCGPKGQRFGYREVDGMVAENCKGCSCGAGWAVYGCYAETASYGAPWVDVVWQQGFEVIRFALLNTGEIKGLAAINKQVAIQNVQVNAVEIVPNGLVDFDIAAQVLATDNFQQQHIWNMQARVVGTCK